jgi:hypothetical protein
MVKRTHAFTALILIALCLNACSNESDKQTKYPFDGERAFGYLEDQVSFGPRNPGSEGAKQALSYYLSHFREFTDSVRFQQFEFTDTILDTTYTLTNVIAKLDPLKTPRVILCAHWDTRPRADKETEPSQIAKPILRANDGASGCAVLMELANSLQEIDTRYGVDIVLFDAEDYGEDGHLDYYCIGSKFFVSNLRSNNPYAFGVLVDLVGDRDLRIYREQYSQAYAPRITSMVWETARKIGATSFVDSIKHRVYDDHLPLIDRGIPTTNIIDFDYDYWHTHGDTPDKCSPESLEEVGKVLVALLAR